MADVPRSPESHQGRFEPFESGIGEAKGVGDSHAGRAGYFIIWRVGSEKLNAVPSIPANLLNRNGVIHGRSWHAEC